MKQTVHIRQVIRVLSPMGHRPSLRIVPKAQRGFSLLEVLISIIILSFGLLGMVGMLATALQSNREARFQSSGVRMARELTELMRSNKNIGVLGTTATNPYLIDFDSGSAITAAPTNCLTGNCYSTAGATAQLALAKFDVQDWLTRINTELPGVKVKVCFDDAPFNGSGVPRWACTDSGTVAVVKVGWTRGTTDKSKTGASKLEKAPDYPPSVVLPVTAGSTT